MEAGKRADEEWLGNTSLEREKAQVQEGLRKLERKVVIFVDDRRRFALAMMSNTYARKKKA